MGLRLVVLAAILGLAQCKMIDLSCRQIRQFVDGHNAKRLEVANGTVPGQPGADEMKSVIWDVELAAMAANWASQNHSGHNPNTTVESGKYTAGENIFTAYQSYELDVDRALQAWFNENKYYTYGPLERSDSTSRPRNRGIGHYTQMIWSDSTHIGCGIGQENVGIWKKFRVVCNYGPSGNWEGEKPYRSGDGIGTLVCGADDDCSRPYGDTAEC